jgi:hypothetical protein
LVGLLDVRNVAKVAE